MNKKTYEPKDMELFVDTVIKNTIDDYYTPGIKSEIILDMLITPEITEWLYAVTGEEDLKLIAKEMPIEKYKENNRCNKADYVVIGKENIYLVELKTTTESKDNSQLETYRNFIKDSKKADEDKEILNGKALLKKLCAILTSPPLSKSMDLIIEYKAKNYKEVMKSFFKTRKKMNKIKNKTRTLTEASHIYQKELKIESTLKYVHTVAQILDKINLEGEDWDKYWDKPMILVYITPEKDNDLGEDVINIALSDVCSEKADNKYKERWKKNKILYYEILKPLFERNEND